MTEWISVDVELPPFDIEVLCKHEDYPNYWVGRSFRLKTKKNEITNKACFESTICTCCSSEPHDFKATHWRFINP